MAQNTIDSAAGDPGARIRGGSPSSADPFREPRTSRRVDCARTPLALRTARRCQYTVEAIAAREGCSVRKVNMTISLAFLAPDLVKAAIEGRLPHGMGVARLCELPAEWSRQYHILGLTAP